MSNNEAEEFCTRSSTMTGHRFRAVASAFAVLINRSWPKREVTRAFASAERESDPRATCEALLHAFAVASGEYPTAMFWWKNEKSEFLGFSERFAAAAGVTPLDLLGRSDADPSVAWNRQAVLYIRDDREVMRSGAPRFDIVERQDRGGATVWLRTSKVPYGAGGGAGTVGGFDTISASLAARLARKARSST